MQVRGADYDVIEEALRRANLKYDNLELDQTGINYRLGGHGYRNGHPRFRLTVTRAKGLGARVSAGMYGQKQRAIKAACWHAFRDFLTELFNLAPNAVVITSMARYEGKEGFEEKFPDTYFQNAGSIMEPHAYGSLCRCGERP